VCECARHRPVFIKWLATLSITSALFAFHAYAEVKLVGEHLLKTPRDRLFAMAVTPGNEVLLLVASDDGTWRLSRFDTGWTSSRLRSLSLFPASCKVGARDGPAGA
jgi:hypothetical protein